MRENETGGANLRINEDGMPYWRLWGVDWKDGEDMRPGKALEMLPIAFPPGTRIIVIEPDIEDPASRAFYAASPDPRNFYPCAPETFGD